MSAKAAVQEGTVNNEGKALAGVRVIDLSQFEAGPSCTQTLAWLGAEVLKVEQPGKGEQSRGASSDTPGWDSYYFMLLNANKRSVTCNLKDPRGIELLKRLIRDADVFIENFGPGVIERLGLGYDVVKEINPRIIYGQIKGFGFDGPNANMLAFDMIAQATGGAMSVTGESTAGPLKSGLTVGDTGTGFHMSVAILAALYQRQSTGVGQHIRVAMQDAVVNYARLAFAAQLMYGRAAPRVGNQSVLGANAPAEAYPCKGDGPNDYCFVYTNRARSAQWNRLLTVIGRPELIGDPRYDTAQERFNNRAEVDAMISAWTRQHTKEEVMQTLGKSGVPAGAIYDTMELSTNPDMLRREIFVKVKHPVRGEFVMPGWPVKMSGSHVPVRASPLVGESTDDVYAQALGLSADEIEAYKKDGVI